MDALKIGPTDQWHGVLLRPWSMGGNIMMAQPIYQLVSKPLGQTKVSISL